MVVDKSPSQNFGDREKQTEAARAAVTQRLGRIAGLEVRMVEAGQADGETDGTRLFSALGAALADVPPDRVAGALSSSPTGACTTCRPKPRSSASTRRCTR